MSVGVSVEVGDRVGGKVIIGVSVGLDKEKIEKRLDCKLHPAKVTRISTNKQGSILRRLNKPIIFGINILTGLMLC